MRRLTSVFSDYLPREAQPRDGLLAAGVSQSAAGRDARFDAPFGGPEQYDEHSAHDPSPAFATKIKREKRARAFQLAASIETAKRSLRLAIPAALLVTTFGAISWGWHTGRLDHWGFRAQSSADASVAGLGLTLQKVKLTRPPTFTRTEDIRAAIGANEGGAILAAEPATIRDNLLSLPWVEDATVERRLPNIIAIGLTERQPTAVWQHQGAFHLIDDRGDVIVSGPEVRQFNDLPRLVGALADEQAIAFLNDLERVPALKRRVRAAVLVNARRWDLLFDNGVRVLLPQKDRLGALNRLANLDKAESLLDRDVIEVDLRLQDRLVVRKGTPTAYDENEGNFGLSPSTKPRLGQPT